MDISKRKRLILEKVVTLYTDSGDPVGSKLLCDLLEGISVSSATLRNEMAELTSLGLLEQPHTSAGRVPTNNGYRYYIDNLLRSYPLTDEEKRGIEAVCNEMDTDPDRAAEEAAEALSELTGLAAITTTPRGGNIQITHFEIMMTGRYNVAVMGVSSVGGVKSRVCRVAQELSAQQLSAVEAVLGDHLVFVSPEDVTPKLLSVIFAILGNDAALLTPIVSAAVAIIKSASEIKVYTGGQQHLLGYKELDEHIKDLLELFSNSMGMKSLLDLSEPLKIYIGDEPGAFGMESLAAIMARYRAAGGRCGALAITGPVRMNYSRIIPRLCYFRDCMSSALTNPGA